VRGDEAGSGGLKIVSGVSWGGRGKGYLGGRFERGRDVTGEKLRESKGGNSF